jgi:hypothetical protein
MQDLADEYGSVFEHYLERANSATQAVLRPCIDQAVDAIEAVH